MPVPGEEIPLPGAVQIVVHGALGLRRADDVLQPRAEQHRAADHRRKVFAVNVAQLAEPPVLLVLVGVKPAGVVAQTLIGDLVRAKVPHELEIAQKRVEDGRAVNKLRVQRRTGQTQPAALRTAVDKDTARVDAVQLPHQAAEDADVLVQPHIVHPLRRAVQPGNDMPGHGGAQKAADILTVAGLTGAVHGNQRHAHARERRLLGKAAGCAGVAVKLQNQRHRLAPARA